MKLELLLSYDVLVTAHREETKEIEFSIEDFEQYVDGAVLTNKADLEELLYMYLADREYDFPVLRDNEEVEWDTFVATVSSFDDLLTELQYLIDK